MPCSILVNSVANTLWNSFDSDTIVGLPDLEGDFFLADDSDNPFRNTSTTFNKSPDKGQLLAKYLIQNSKIYQHFFFRTY